MTIFILLHLHRPSPFVYLYVIRNGIACWIFINHLCLHNEQCKLHTHYYRTLYYFEWSHSFPFLHESKKKVTILWYQRWFHPLSWFFIHFQNNNQILYLVQHMHKLHNTLILAPGLFKIQISFYDLNFFCSNCLFEHAAKNSWETNEWNKFESSLDLIHLPLITWTITLAPSAVVGIQV